MGSYAYQFKVLLFSEQRETSLQRADDFQKDIDWIFKINEICISNRKQTKTLTNRIQCAFDEYFFQILQKT